MHMSIILARAKRRRSVFGVANHDHISDTARDAAWTPIALPTSEPGSPQITWTIL
jgi:hypothetical protein